MVVSILGFCAVAAVIGFYLFGVYVNYTELRDDINSCAEHIVYHQQYQDEPDEWRLKRYAALKRRRWLVPIWPIVGVYNYAKDKRRGSDVRKKADKIVKDAK